MLLGLAYAIARHGAIQYAGDSAGYMFFHPTRPIGYPLILWLLHGVTPDYAAVPYLQAAALGLSIGALAVALARASGRLWPGAAFAALAAGNPAYWALTPQMLSDALSAATLNLLAAVVVASIRDRGAWRYWAYALLSFVAITIRPVNVVAGVVGAIAVWQLPRERGWRHSLVPAAAIVLAAVAGYEASPFAQLWIHGRAAAANPLARGLFQKTLFFEQGPAPAPGLSAQDRQIIAAARGPVLAYLAEAPKTIRPKLERGYADYLRFAVIIPSLSRIHQVRDDWEIDPLLAHYAASQIKAFPARYASEVLREDLRLLSYQGWNDRRTQQTLAQFVTAHPMPLPAAVPPTAFGLELDRKARAALRLPPRPAAPATPSEMFRASHVLPVPLILALRLTHAAAALAGLAAIGACLWPRLIPKAGRDHVRAMAVLGCLLHGETLLTSVSEFGQLRYITPLWSVVLAILALGLLAAEKAWRPRRLANRGVSAQRPLASPVA
jgi:hypothetical protein